MNYFLKLLAKKIKTMSFTTNDGDVVAATLLQLYPHYFFSLKKNRTTNNLILSLCSKALSLRKRKLTKAQFCLFEHKHLNPMSKIFHSVIKEELVNDFIRNGILNENYRFLPFIRLDKLQCNVINVVARSKGRGFTGTIKRFNFKQGPKTHGSKSYRRPGSIGAGTDPGRVLKNKKMAGHFGDRLVTIMNLEVLYKNGYNLIVKGSVPGPVDGDVFVIIDF